MADPELDLRREALRSLASAPAGHGGGVVGEMHTDVIRATVLTWLDASRRAPTRLEALRCMVVAERSWSYLQLAVGQRATFAGAGQGLVLADRAAADGYTAGLRAARALGIPARPGRRLPAPLVLIEAMASPATFVGGSRISGPGLQRDASDATEIPFPLVLIPLNHLGCAWLLTVLQHEVGHDLDQELGLSAELRLTIGAKEPDARRRGRWEAWTREVVADAIGIGLAGPPFAYTLGRLLEEIGLDALDPDASDHPVSRARLGLCVEIVRRLHGEQAASSLAPFRSAFDSDAPPATRPYMRYLPALADALLGTRLRALRGGALRDLFSRTADDLGDIERGQKILATRPIAKADTIPWRLVASCAELEARRCTAPELSALHTRVLATDGDDPHPLMAARQAEFLAADVATMRAPLLDEERHFQKTPRLEAFIDCRRIAYVGATDDGLARVFDLAKTCLQRPKVRIEIYFLGPRSVPGLRNPARSAEELLEARRGVEGELRRRLPAIAESWAIYEHDEPYFFGSYTDWREPGGVIHVSNHIWGLDIRFTPAIDYEWERGASEPDERYRQYALGLDGPDGLRARARLLAGSRETP